MKCKVAEFLLAVLIIPAKAWVLPVEKCRLEDSKCMISSVQNIVQIFFNGIPELGVEKMQGLDNISFELSGLKFTFTNPVTELEDITVDSVNWNRERKYVDIEYHLSGILKGHYTAQGKVLLLDIEGDGEAEFIMKKFATKMRIFYEIEKLADGKDHLKPTNYTFEFYIKDHIEFKMTNLFNGNKELGDAVMKFVNENWREVSTKFGAPIVDKFSYKIFKNIVKFFEVLPLEEVAIT